jgi:hypothetical protein
MRLRFAALVVFAAVALGGCGSAGSSEPVTAPPPSIGDSVDASGGSSTGSAAGTPSTQPADPSGAVVVIHGTVADGVEAGCVLLNTDSKAYLLIGGDRAAMKSGAKLTVHGVPQPDLMTTCQQGTPFQVTKIEP